MHLNVKSDSDMPMDDLQEYVSRTCYSGSTWVPSQEGTEISQSLSLPPSSSAMLQFVLF